MSVPTPSDVVVISAISLICPSIVSTSSLNCVVLVSNFSVAFAISSISPFAWSTLKSAFFVAVSRVSGNS